MLVSPKSMASSPAPTRLPGRMLASPPMYGWHCGWPRSTMPSAARSTCRTKGSAAGWICATTAGSVTGASAEAASGTPPETTAGSSPS